MLISSQIYTTKITGFYSLGHIEFTLSDIRPQLLLSIAIDKLQKGDAVLYAVFIRSIIANLWCMSKCAKSIWTYSWSVGLFFAHSLRIQKAYKIDMLQSDHIGRRSAYSTDVNSRQSHKRKNSPSNLASSPVARQNTISCLTQKVWQEKVFSGPLYLFLIVQKHIITHQTKGIDRSDATTS